MRKFSAILIILICSLLTTSGHGKVIGKQAIDIPVIPGKTVQQNSGSVNAVMFDEMLVPPLLILMVLPS